MKTKLFLSTAAAAALAATFAFAQSSTDSLVSQLQEQGFTRIEVKRGPSQMKVEAVRGTTKREMVYDIATGKLLKDEQGQVRAGDDTAPGVEIGSDDGDFMDDDHNDDAEDDDNDDDHSGSDSDDDSEDDDHGSDHSGSGSDDDSDDHDDDHDDDGGDDSEDD
ncbi:MAG: PepSY domain-containing protein [Paracoccaceae bacterium]